jgi:hypothetical protein
MKIDGRQEVSAHGTRDMPVWGYKLSGEFKNTSIGEELVRGNISVLVDYLKSVQE